MQKFKKKRPKPLCATCMNMFILVEYHTKGQRAYSVFKVRMNFA